MNKNEKFWVQEAIDKALYLHDLDVDLVKIREDILKSQDQEFWENRRTLLLELLLDYLQSVYFFKRDVLTAMDADIARCNE